MKAVSFACASGSAIGAFGVSTKMADSPGARVVTPSSAPPWAIVWDESVIRQPVRFTVTGDSLVSSNQSASYSGQLLPHGATSVTATGVFTAAVPGVPISLPPSALIAPGVPAVVRVVISGSVAAPTPRPAVLSKLPNGAEPGEAPNSTPETLAPVES